MFKVTIYCSNGDRVIHLSEDIKSGVKYVSEFNKGELVGFNIYKLKEVER